MHFAYHHPGRQNNRISKPDKSLRLASMGGRQEDEIDRFWRSKIAPEVQGIATIIKKVVKNCDQSGQPILWQAASNGKHWHTTCKAG